MFFKRSIAGIFVFLILVCLALACEVTDDSGQLIRLQTHAQRIISLAPDITENLFAIGAGDQLVGVISGSDYPTPAKNILPVGSYLGLDIEKILALKPHLIVSWGTNFSKQLQLLKNWGIPIYITNPRRLEDIPRTLINLGCLSGHELKASAVAESYLQRLKDLSARYQSQQQVSVFYQIGSYSLLTINKTSWINQVIQLCGGINIFAHTHSLVSEVGWEAVLAANPQVIVSDATQADWQMRWQAWPQLSAVKNHFFLKIHPDLIDRASPRLLDGARQLCAYLQMVRAVGAKID